MEQPVTAGVDGSPESLAAAGWAAQEASRRNLPLRLLQVWEWLPSNPHFPLGPEEQRHWAENRLRTAEQEIARGSPGLEVTAEQVPGVPAELLLRAAAEAELLALGSRGLGGLAGFLYGSVGLQVIARAVRPVVLVRAGGAGRAPGPVLAPRLLGVLLDEVDDALDEGMRQALQARPRRFWTQ